MMDLMVIPRISDRVDERAVRTTLRRQIAELERRLAMLTVELAAFGERVPGTSGEAGERARLLTVGELEVTRDRLVFRIRAAEELLAERATHKSHAQRALESMLTDPCSHRFEVIHLADLGQPGCGSYQVRPVLGLLGMLFSWWRVKLSSGCP